MKKLFTVMFAGLMMLTALGTSAAEKGTADEAVAMVKKAAEFLKKNGKEKAFAEFNNPKGQFIQKDLYIFAFGANGDGVELANGANIKLVGKNVLEMKDADGKFLIKDILALGMGKEGKGWVDYKWPNPSTGTVDGKRTYVERVDDVVIGCGIYK
ncbi:MULTISPECIES: cache domain-containing protein [unclassified Duganella]|uniref:cache domain-containing protein n=1 Tax=unclassified Duganella TaxID=2636909 RepID=UPI000E348C06|nr:MULTISPECIES: cache domain-containing protein [unclassified Duganella]RFP18613.1 histidine kinase [Duganella sp. BJB475]RFP35278.1 histidine kinase [Duganella sp. BJB476]